MEPKVSVVIPCYNQGQYVAETVASVLAQTFDDFEIIIINDGSTDETTNDLLARYSPPKTSIIQTENQGLAAARNNGIRAAKGQYILPLDADDKIEPTYLEKAVSYLESHPETGIVYCKAMLFGAVETEWDLPEFSLETILLDNVIFCSALFRKADWEMVGGFDTDLIYGWEDYEFWLSLLELGRQVYRIPEHLFYYRVSADSMVRARPRQHKLETFARIFRKHQQLFSDNIEVWLDKLLDVREIYHEARLILDGETEDENDARYIRKVDTGTSRLEFPLESTGNEKLIFQPAEDFVVIKLEKITLIEDDGGTHELQWESNAFVENRTCFFDVLPPNVHIYLPPENEQTTSLSGRVVIDLQYQCIGRDCIRFLMDNLKKKQLSTDREDSVDDRANREKSRKSPGLKVVASLLRFFQLLRFVVSYRNLKNYRFILQSGFFDPQYYLQQYSNLNALFRKNPLLHYLVFGWREGANPNAFFDSLFYIRANREMISEGMNPVIHYLRHGFAEQCHPVPLFDTSYYLEDNPSVARQRIPLLLHYIRHGALEGRSPNRFFDPEFVRQQNTLPAEPAWKVFEWYLVGGVAAGNRPSALFDPAYYARQYPEFAETHAFPLIHYQEKGVLEGKYPCLEVAALKRKPVISILVPVYNTDELLLRKCIHSVLYQAYPHWELCLVDDASNAGHVRGILQEYAAMDGRIKVRFSEENKGISATTNEAASMASGDFLGFLDHDDELTLDALFEIAKCINANDPDIMYSDENLVNLESRYLDTFYKPAYNPELLLCHNYITHFLVVRKSCFEAVRGFANEYSGAQDYDLSLKLVEQSPQIVHIPKALYNWRAHETSTSINHQQKEYAHDAGKMALAEAVQRRHIAGEVGSGQWKYYYRVKRAVRDNPLVSVILRENCGYSEMRNRVQELIPYLQYENLELLLGTEKELGSKEIGALRELCPKCTVHSFAGAQLGPAEQCNRLAEKAGGEHLLFLDGHVVPRNEDWIESLIEYSQEDAIGLVTGRLVNWDAPDDSFPVLPDLQNRDWQYYRTVLLWASCHLNGIGCAQDIVIAPSFFCMVKKSIYQGSGGFDQEVFPAVMYDVDFSLRLARKGFRNIYTPFSTVFLDQMIYKEVPEPAGNKEMKKIKEKWYGELPAVCRFYNEKRLLKERGLAQSDWHRWLTGR